MPLDQVGQRYATTLYNTKSEELQKQHLERAKNVRLDFINRRMERSGLCFSAIAREGAQFVEELANAWVDSQLEAYRHSHLPVDDQAVADISRDADALCDAQGRNVANLVAQQLAQAGLPPATSAAIAARVNHVMAAAKSAIHRRLSLVRDEQILAARKAPSPDPVSGPAREPMPQIAIPDSRHPNLLIRGWRAIKKWPWFGGLFAAAFLMLTVQEYVLSIPLLVLAAVSLASKLWYSETTRPRKCLGSAGIAVAAVVLLYIVVAVKGQTPWSHLQAPIQRGIDKGLTRRAPAQAPASVGTAKKNANALLPVTHSTQSPPKRRLPTDERAPHAVRSSVQIAPHGIAITGGTVINPTVNNFAQQEANITATLVDPPQPLAANHHPSIFIKVSLDHAMENAKFAVVCDRPCHATGIEQATPGILAVSTGTVDHRPNIAAFSMNAPNPFPPDSPVILIVESDDESPVHMVRVERLASSR